MRAYVTMGLLLLGGIASANDPAATPLRTQSRTLKNGVVVDRVAVHNPDGSLQSSATVAHLGATTYKNTKVFDPSGTVHERLAVKPAETIRQTKYVTPAASGVTEDHEIAQGTTTVQLPALDSSRLGRSLK